MQPEQAERLAELVEHAFELEGAERAGFLAQACGDDAELRAEVEALLREEERAARLMSAPAVEFGAELLREELRTASSSRRDARVTTGSFLCSAKAAWAKFISRTTRISAVRWRSN